MGRGEAPVEVDDGTDNTCEVVLHRRSSSEVPCSSITAGSSLAKEGLHLNPEEEEENEGTIKSSPHGDEDSFWVAALSDE
jgi:hypothetical protein